MSKIVQCVPNFSEGRRPEVIKAITDEVISVPGVKILDVNADPSHNRVVVTFVGEPQAVKEAAFRSCKKASELIDMEKHTGEHPRIGATDVIPFIPVRNVTMEECVELARELGAEINEKLDIPIFLYEEAAKIPTRRALPDVRKGQYEGLKVEISKPERHPDFGAPRMHPTAGAFNSVISLGLAQSLALYHSFITNLPARIKQCPTNAPHQLVLSSCHHALAVL